MVLFEQFSVKIAIFGLKSWNIWCTLGSKIQKHYWILTQKFKLDKKYTFVIVYIVKNFNKNVLNYAYPSSNFSSIFSLLSALLSLKKMYPDQQIMARFQYKFFLKILLLLRSSQLVFVSPSFTWAGLEPTEVSPGGS